MTITINKDSFPRFTKRLKKSLQKSGIDLPLNQVQEVAAQSLGKENFYELNTLFDKKNKELIPIEDLPADSKEISLTSFKDYEWFIEEASLKIGIGMGRIGQSIGQEYIKEAVMKSLQHILSKNQKVTLSLTEAQLLVECYGGDNETDITVSRFKDDNKLYGWFTEYPEEGRMLLEKDTFLFNEEKKNSVSCFRILYKKP